MARLALHLLRVPAIVMAAIVWTLQHNGSPLSRVLVR
jgi:hypothetical protein